MLADRLCNTLIELVGIPSTTGHEEHIQNYLERQLAGRGLSPGLRISQLPGGAVIATSSTRRRAQLLNQNPLLKVPEIRGNVITRLEKLARRRIAARLPGLRTVHTRRPAAILAARSDRVSSR